MILNFLLFERFLEVHSAEMYSTEMYWCSVNRVKIIHAEVHKHSKLQKDLATICRCQ